MRQYKVETLAGQIFVIEYENTPTMFQDVKHGPYKNEDSAKRRIRDLKRKEAAIEEPVACEPEAEKIEAAADKQNERDQSRRQFEIPTITIVRQVGAYPAIPKSAYRR